MIAYARRLAIRSLVAAMPLAFVAHGQSVVPPLPSTGAYPVACSNIEQDFSRLEQGETADMYWRGSSGGNKDRYVDALLVSPANALTSTVSAPADVDLYDRWSGQSIAYVFIACYPTIPGNTRADYALPGGNVVPRMQRGDEAPMLPASPSRWPVLLYSHGYGGSPVDGNYLNALIAFASWGYVVVAPFHGDLRYSVFGPDSAGFVAKHYIPIWSEFVAMQAIRPLSLSAGLTLLTVRPEWQAHIDAARVGAFGISQGGETLMLQGSAQLNYNLMTFATKPVMLDTRVRAAVGYIPYFGIESVPAFGNAQVGAQGVTLPYLGISGTLDPIAPPDITRMALDKMTGPRGHVLINGHGHDLDPRTGADILTWSLAFLAAWVNDDAAAKNKLTQVVSVEGGLDDTKMLYVDPTFGGDPSGSVVDTIEYHNPSLDHYFITAFPEEAAALDAGQPPGWRRTGQKFRSWKSGTGPGNEACRFFGTPGRGPNSHFYTINIAECESVRVNPDWTFEAFAFRAIEPLAGGCAAPYATVTRLYNNGIGGEANHRYLTDTAEIDATVARGWSIEGAVFCVPQ